MTYDQFITANLGKPVEREDVSALDQCFDWAFAYCDDVLGVPRSAIRHDVAYKIWTEATDETRKYFDLIPNTPDGVPQKGDIVVFGREVGPSGHVCIADGNAAGTGSFQSTDQNWNAHKYIEYVWHTYGGLNGVLGWLRPKALPTDPIASNGTYYKGYDLTNQDSMKVAIDVLVRVQSGEFVDKSKYDADVEVLKKQEEELQGQISDLEKKLATQPPIPQAQPVPKTFLEKLLYWFR